jgi:hypothetical protein
MQMKYVQAKLTAWFMVSNATFINFPVISWGQFYWWRKLEYPEKSTGLNKMFKAEEIGKKKEYFKEKSKTKQNKATWTGVSMLAA